MLQIVGLAGGEIRANNRVHFNLLEHFVQSHSLFVLKKEERRRQFFTGNKKSQSVCAETNCFALFCRWKLEDARLVLPQFTPVVLYRNRPFISVRVSANYNALFIWAEAAGGGEIRKSRFAGERVLADFFERFPKRGEISAALFFDYALA